MAPDSSTIDINKSLKEYLNRNESGTSEEKSNLLRSWSLDSWFNRSSNSLDGESQDKNSWFSQAENDALCPTLVKFIFNLILFKT